MRSCTLLLPNRFLDRYEEPEQVLPQRFCVLVVCLHRSFLRTVATLSCRFTLALRCGFWLASFVLYCHMKHMAIPLSRLVKGRDAWVVGTSNRSSMQRTSYFMTARYIPASLKDHFWSAQSELDHMNCTIGVYELSKINNTARFRCGRCSEDMECH